MNIEAEVINLNLPLAFSTKDALTDAIEDIFSGIFLQKENLKIWILQPFRLFIIKKAMS
jgi:hypothetical protein